MQMPLSKPRLCHQLLACVVGAGQPARVPRRPAGARGAPRGRGLALRGRVRRARVLGPRPLPAELGRRQGARQAARQGAGRDDDELRVAACEIALALLHPFEWAQVYVPTIPDGLLGLLANPFPCVLGLRHKHAKGAKHTLALPPSASASWGRP